MCIIGKENASPALVEKETEYYLDKEIHEFNKKFASSKVQEYH